MGFTSEGYKKLREEVASWTHIAIVNNSGTEAFRVAKTDPRFSVISDASNNPYKFKVVISGNDSEVTIGTTTVKGIKLYNQATGGTALAEYTYPNPFYFNDTSDTCTLEITVEIPAMS